MPTYAYQCQSCGVHFDKVQKFTDKALTRCPECRKGRVHRVMQPSAIVFKGSGWYATDSRSASGAGKRSSKTEKSEGGGEKGEQSPAKTDKTETSDKADNKPAKSEANSTTSSSNGSS